MLARTPSLYRLIVALKPPTRITRQIDHFAETLAPDAHRILPAHQHITLGITDDWPDYPYALVKAMHRSFTGILADPFDLSLDQLSEGGRSAALRPAHALPPLRELQRKVALAMKRAGVAPVRAGASTRTRRSIIATAPRRPSGSAAFTGGWRISCCYAAMSAAPIMSCWGDGHCAAAANIAYSEGAQRLRTNSARSTSPLMPS